MPPRKRKVPEKATDENAEESTPEQSKNNDKAERKRKNVQKKSNEVETVMSPQPTEKHVVLKILLNAQTNEAFHAKYMKELANQYAKVRNFLCFVDILKIHFSSLNRLVTTIFWQCLSVA